MLGILLVQLVVDSFSEDWSDPLFYVFLVAFALVPVAFLAGVLRSRLARVGVADLLVELGRGTPLRDALAHALRDPSLDLVYWLPDRKQLVLPDGTEFHDDGSGRVRYDVERNGQLVGALVHDPSLADEPELVDAVAAAAALWLENERLQAEVRAQFVFLETIVNTAPSLLMSLEPDGRIANYNAACERASGFENVEEVRQEYFWDVFISAEERDEVRARFEANPAHPAATWENTFVNRRGEELVIAWSTAPLLDEAGNVRNIICGGLDVTERKQHELELDRERDFLSKVANITPSLLVLVDDSARIVEDAVNESFVHVMGWSNKEMRGRSFGELFHEEDRYFAAIGVASAFNGVDPPAAAVALGHARGPAADRSSGPRRRSWTSAAASACSCAASTSPSGSGASTTCARARSGCGRRSRRRRSRCSRSISRTGSRCGIPPRSGCSAGRPRRWSAGRSATSRRRSTNGSRI